MSCLSCGSKFRLFNREKDCPACGKEYCASCLQYSMAIESLGGAKKKVCGPCFHSATKPEDAPYIDPVPKAFKVMRAARPPSPQAAAGSPAAQNTKTGQSPSGVPGRPGPCPADDEILKRLAKLHEDGPEQKTEDRPLSDDEIKRRLDKLRGDAEGDATGIQKPIVIYSHRQKTAQEQEEDLLAAASALIEIEKETAAQNDIERRLQNLRKDCPIELAGGLRKARMAVDSEKEEESSADLVKRLLKEAELELKSEQICKDGNVVVIGGDDVPEPPNRAELDELPWCVICNEDAAMRCLDCDSDLYCRRCFNQFHDKDDPHRAKAITTVE